MKFDVIVGNPPYQGPHEGSNSYWKKFIIKSFYHLNDNGYLSYLTPNGWVNDNKVRPLIQSKQLLYANLDVSNYFNVGSTITHFTVKNSNNSNPSMFTYLDDTYKYNFSEGSILPTNDFSNISVSLYKKFSEYGDYLNVKSMGGYRDVSKVKTHEYKYKAFNTDAQPVVYLKRNFYKEDKKIIFTSCSRFNPFFDDGKTSVARQCQIIIVESEKNANSILSFFNTKLFKFIEKNTRTGGWIGISNMIPNIGFTSEWDDSRVYEHFNLNDKEIDYIENAIK